MTGINTRALDRELKRGSAELLILSLLDARPRHGYELSKLIHARSGGQLTFHIDSLYPLLYRLEERGWIKGTWVEKPDERRRRFYKVTAEGRRVLAAAAEDVGGVRRGRAPRHGRRTCLICDAPATVHAARDSSSLAPLADPRGRDRRRALAASGRPLPGVDRRRRVTRRGDAPGARRLPERQRSGAAHGAAAAGARAGANHAGRTNRTPAQRSLAGPALRRTHRSGSSPPSPPRPS